MSPAPVVSTGTTGVAGFAQDLARRVHRRAPSAPSLTTTTGPRAASARAAASTIGRSRPPPTGRPAPAPRPGWAAAGRGAAARPSTPVQRSAGSKLVSSDVVRPRARVPRPAARAGAVRARGSRKNDATCTCRAPSRTAWSSGAPGLVRGQLRDRARVGERSRGRRGADSTTVTPVDRPGSRTQGRGVDAAGRRAAAPSGRRAGPRRSSATSRVDRPAGPARARRSPPGAADDQVGGGQQLLGLTEPGDDVTAAGSGRGWHHPPRGRRSRASVCTHASTNVHTHAVECATLLISGAAAMLPAGDHHRLRRCRLRRVHPSAAARPAHLRRPARPRAGDARHRPGPARRWPSSSPTSPCVTTAGRPPSARAPTAGAGARPGPTS